MSNHICFYGGASNEYPQYNYILLRTGENVPRIIIKYSSLTNPLTQMLTSLAFFLGRLSPLSSIPVFVLILLAETDKCSS